MSGSQRARLKRLLARRPFALHLVYLERMSLTPEARRIDGSAFAQYRTQWLDRDAVTTMPPDMLVDAWGGRANYGTWMDQGAACLGLLDGDRIAAAAWVNRKVCRFHGYRRRLREDEAYLFATVTSKDYRGRGLAPYLWREAFTLLAEEGRVRLYSGTSMRNRAALRFKSKLGCHHLALYLCVRVLKVAFAVRLWTFRPPAPGHPMPPHSSADRGGVP